MTIKTHKGEAETAPCFSQTAIPESVSLDANPKWTSQRRFVVTEKHVNTKWGTTEEQMKCGICRRPFEVGDTARWVCATAHRCLNFFVCEADDTSDVIEVWQHITQLAQQDEYDLAAKIAQLEWDLGRCATAERGQASTSDVFNNPERGIRAGDQPESSSPPPDAGVVVSETEATLAEIKERRRNHYFWGAGAEDDIDTLLSIIDSPLNLKKDGAFVDEVYRQVLLPAVCGIPGHFFFQENGGNCMMCQREQRAASNMKTLIVERVKESAAQFHGFKRDALMEMAAEIEAFQPNDLSER